MQINSAPVTVLHSKHIEVVKIKLINNDWLVIHGVYRSPNSSADCLTDNLTELATIFKSDRGNFNSYSHKLIVGDFNMKEINWTNETTPVSENHISSLFLETFGDRFLIQQVSKPTRMREHEIDSLLDLILTNEENIMEELQYLPPLGKSDNSVLDFNLILYSEDNVTVVDKRNYFKGDYDGIRSSLQKKRI